MRTALLLAGICLGLSASAQAEEWVSLFDGETLDGWEVKGGSAEYAVEDGAIVGTTKEGSPNTFLCRGPYSDFELELEVLCDPALNSGIQVRSHTYEKPTPQAGNPDRVREAGSVYGPQCEIVNSDVGQAGNFWDEARRTKWLGDLSDSPEAQKAFKDNEWNHYRIRVQGDHYQSWVNGIPCADFHDSEDESGFIGLQVHSIRRGTGPYQVRWRNIKLRELSEEDSAE